MTRCVPAALLLLLVAGPAAAEMPRYHVHDTVYGCVDPRATLGLSGRDGHLHRDGWSAEQRRSGRCFLLTPRLQLETIARHVGLVLVRRVPPRAGEPPLYVMAQDLRVVVPARAPLVPRVAGAALAEAAGAAPTAMATSQAVRPASTTDMAASSAPGPEPRVSDPPTPDAMPAGHAVDPATPAEPGPAGAVAMPAGSTPPLVPAPGNAMPTVAVTGGSLPAGAPATPTSTDRTDRNMTVPGPPPAAWPPKAVRPSYRPGRGLLSSVLVTLLLVPFVVGALLVARRRRHFAHVEDELSPPERSRLTSRSSMSGTEVLPNPQSFRKECADALQQAGWATRLAFPGDGGGPDIVGQRGDSLIVVRCRVSGTAITGEMVDEAAAMGARQGRSMTVLASNAPFSQRARDEAGRQQVHLLRDTDLATFAL